MRADSGAHVDAHSCSEEAQGTRAERQRRCGQDRACVFHRAVVTHVGLAARKFRRQQQADIVKDRSKPLAARILAGTVKFKPGVLDDSEDEAEEKLARKRAKREAKSAITLLGPMAGKQDHVSAKRITVSYVDASLLSSAGQARLPESRRRFRPQGHARKRQAACVSAFLRPFDAHSCRLGIRRARLPQSTRAAAAACSSTSVQIARASTRAVTCATARRAV